ncbi:MAG TPA: class I SAM-dependent methyltransferase [Chitinophagales bacterium]|nr:class I SAM-dependent methyltransferase [Chitinophagales bacterium]
MNCRFCKTPLSHVFIDLVNAPASNSFLSKEQLNEPEVFFPLKVYTCHSCMLVQIDEFKKSDAIFDSNYVYFSSYSKSWLKHAKDYTNMMTERFGFNQESFVIEIASNDGYLLQYFKEKNIPVLGIEPTKNTADAAKEKGIESVVDFFGVRLAEKLVAANIKADLLLGNNVLAHVPDIVDFVGGMKIILNDKGVITMEFPHLLQLVENNQFDTIYHEHFSYLSFYTVQKIFYAQSLEIFDVEEIPTHGGSLRIFAKHKADESKIISDRVAALLFKEEKYGLFSIDYYNEFQQKALKVKLDFTDFLITQKRNNKKVAAYGAAAKGNTLLNYCGIKNDLITFVVDANPHKQDKYLPGSHIPVVDEHYIREHKPDFVIIFPWNLKEELTGQLSYIKEWGGKFVIPIPVLEII